jgi:ribulose-5-phosphate 4-epimerase/fuculose-1-phosphate aldolase
MVDDLVAASRILANEGVLDCFGHVSVRSPTNPGRYLLSRNLAPELVTAADIMEFEVESSNPVEHRDRPLFLERFIHGGIYKIRPDVNAIVHSHSPSVIPFSIVSSVPMRPVYHMSGFLHAGVPIYEIRNDAGMSDMLIRSVELGSALARVLGEKSVALLRGHGNGSGTYYSDCSLPSDLYRDKFTAANASAYVRWPGRVPWARGGKKNRRCGRHASEPTVGVVEEKGNR